MHIALAIRKAPKEHKSILNVLLSKGPLSQAKIKEGSFPDMAQSSFSRIMRDMADMGFVERVGAGRQAAWSATEAVKSFALPPQLRPKMPFDDSRVIGHGKPFLSEAQSQKLKEVTGGMSFDASTLIQGLSERFLIDLSWASSKLEGNTYDYLDTEKLITHNETADGRDRIESVMILNHKNAIKWLLEKAENGTALDVNDVCVLHAHLMRGLMHYSELGQIRNNAVSIGGSTYVPSTDHLMLRSGIVNLIHRAGEQSDPQEASIGLLAGASYLQAFGDGNKRVGRLLASLPLLRAGLPPLSFVGWDKAEYITGLIVFYETGNPEILADGFVNNQMLNGPTYSAMVKAQRIPRRIEVVRQEDIRNTLIEVLKGASVEEAVRARFSPEEQEDAVETVKEMKAALTKQNAEALGIPLEFVTDEEGLKM